MYGGYDSLSAYFYNAVSGQYMTASSVCMVLAVVGGVAGYFVFLAPHRETGSTDYTDWLCRFLDFQKQLLEPLLKILYMVGAVYITAFSIYLMFASEFWWMFLACIVVGNVGLRILFEFMMLIVRFFGNVSDINRKLKDEAKAEVPTQKVAPETPAGPSYPS